MGFYFQPILGLISYNVLKVIWLGLAVIGMLLRHWVGARKFKRRNAAGMEMFSSYTKARLTVLFERLVNLVALLLIIAGLGLFVFMWLGGPKR